MTKGEYRALMILEMRQLRRAVERACPVEPDPPEPTCPHPAESRVSMGGMGGVGERSICKACGVWIETTPSHS